MTALLGIKLATRYAQLRDVESMRAIARAHKNRNLADFEQALKDYQKGECCVVCCAIRWRGASRRAVVGCCGVSSFGVRAYAHLVFV